MLNNISNSKYTYLFFDLDGTLTDSQRGITRCVQIALEHFGINVQNTNDLLKFVGPPLRSSFREFYDLTDEQAETAVTIYNRHYNSEGLFENQPYPGIAEMLKQLTDLGCRLNIATSKPAELADKILAHFGLRSYFDNVYGGKPTGICSTKAGVITHALQCESVENPKREALMIGDRKHDILGAQIAGIDSVGVLWGYGSQTELEQAHTTYMIQAPEELVHLLGA